MKTTEIQELIDFITKSGLEEVNIETEAIKIHVKRSLVIPQQLPTMVSSGLPLAPSAPLVQPPSVQQSSLETNYLTIKSPMIGTFYRSPNPGQDPFVKEGDIIAQGTKLCIIEAMKLYNEIESEVAGKIIQILVDDVAPVEYDHPLFLIEPISG